MNDKEIMNSALESLDDALCLLYGLESVEGKASTVMVHSALHYLYAIANKDDPRSPM